MPPRIRPTIELPFRKPSGGPTALNAKMLKMIRLMVDGHDGDPTPVDIYEAGAAVGYRRKAARCLASSQLFVDAYEVARAGSRNPNPVPTFNDVRRDIERQASDRHRAARAASAGYVTKLPEGPG